jgi:hypothetical protein
MKTLSLLISGLLLLGPALQTVNARQLTNKKTSSIDQVKLQVAKLGVGEKARATITTTTGAKIKGYVYRAGDDDFEMRDRQTGTPTIVRYADVSKVERHHGHSIAKIVLISVTAGTAIVLAAIYAAIARNG